MIFPKNVNNDDSTLFSSYQRPNGIPRTIEYMKLGSEASTNIRHSDHRETNASFSTQFDSTRFHFEGIGLNSTQLLRKNKDEQTKNCDA